MYDYFKAEGSDILYPILISLGLKKKEFTVADLIKGIKAGQLDEEVIN